MTLKHALILGTMACWIVSLVYFVVLSVVADRPPMGFGALLGLWLWSLIFAGFFFVCAALVTLPSLSVLQRSVAGRSRVLLALTGGMLTCLTAGAAMILIFHGPDDPQTLAELVTYWRRVPGELIGLLPFLFGGAVLGAFSRPWDEQRSAGAG